MAKRFTDTDKWKDPWFNELTMKAKLAWIYLLDNCDFAGIWKADFRLLSFYMGEKITESDIESWFSGRIIKTRDAYFVVSFYNFQYGSSKDGFRAKQSALRKIHELGLPVLIKPNLDSGGTLNGQSPDCLSGSSSIGISKSISKGDVQKFDLRFKEPEKQELAAKHLSSLFKQNILPQSIKNKIPEILDVCGWDIGRLTGVLDELYQSKKINGDEAVEGNHRAYVSKAVLKEFGVAE